MSQSVRAQTHVMKEYPKWIERDGEPVLVRSADDELMLENSEERDSMIKELEEVYGKSIDPRTYEGNNGFGALKAYYEAVVNREGGDNVNNGDSD